MNKTLFIDNIFSAFKNFNSHTDDYLGVMFMNIFQALPHSYRIYFDNKDELKFLSTSERFDCHKDTKSKIDDRHLLHECLKYSKDHDDMFCFCYSGNEWLALYNTETCHFLINITLSDDEDLCDFYINAYTDNIDETYQLISKWMNKVEKHACVEFGIAAVDTTNTLYTAWYDYNEHIIDINANYNDDIPYDKMCSLLEKTDKPELLLFYGEPGTGKSTLIKHFISKYPDKDFVFMDGSLLANVPQEKLMSYFLENQNTIFILEDCEKVLMNREHYVNPVMPILLNLTDGIIGDVLGIKLICTFNTSLNNIDKALVRKGRLSLKYEFKKLTKDKVKVLLNDDSINSDMTLADLYYNKEENDFSKKTTGTIGFR